MCLFASLGAASLVALSATAQTPAPSTTTTSTPAPADSAPVKLPYGVEDVLKLSRAQVSEDVTLNFIHNSGTIYNLAPKDIVYLHNEGVSDRVINAMLDQRKNVPAEMAAQTAPPARPLRRQHLSIRTPTPLPPRRHRHNMPRLMLNRPRFTFSLNPLTLRPPPSIRFPIRPRPTLTTTVATLTTTAGILTITAPRLDRFRIWLRRVWLRRVSRRVSRRWRVSRRRVMAVGGMAAAGTTNRALLSRRSSSLGLFGRT